MQRRASRDRQAESRVLCPINGSKDVESCLRCTLYRNGQCGLNRAGSSERAALVSLRYRAGVFMH